MFKVNLFLFAGWICLGGVGCILSRNSGKNYTEKTDTEAAQSINRDYTAGFEENYGHGSYGLSAHAAYGFPEEHDGYGVIEGSKHHIQSNEDHHHQQHHHHHKHYDYGYHKALAIKSLLVPLAGVALLGAAAAFVSNPILLQLGVISGSSLGRRKRSLIANSTPFKVVMSQENQIRMNKIKLLERFMSQVPEQSIETQEKKMLANYVSWSGMTGKNLCLERLACELHSAEGTSMPMEASVLTIVVNEILDNSFIPDDIKIRLSKAVQRGKKNFGCAVYDCEEIENQDEVMKANYT